MKCNVIESSTIVPPSFSNLQPFGFADVRKACNFPNITLKPFCWIHLRHIVAHDYEGNKQGIFFYEGWHKISASGTRMSKAESGSETDLDQCACLKTYMSWIFNSLVTDVRSVISRRPGLAHRAVQSWIWERDLDQCGGAVCCTNTHE